MLFNLRNANNTYGALAPTAGVAVRRRGKGREAH
jgi:hypothetical protein